MLDFLLSFAMLAAVLLMACFGVETWDIINNREKNDKYRHIKKNNDKIEKH